MQSETDQEPTRKRPWKGAAITIAIIAVVVVLLVFNSPRGFDSDLSKIGAGQPALVLVYDPNLVVTGEQVHEMNMIRGDLEAQVQFLVADMGHPETKHFMSQHRVRPADLLIFDAEGSLLKVLQGPVAADKLADEVNKTLGWEDTGNEQ